jgi:hypothetical protein
MRYLGRLFVLALTSALAGAETKFEFWPGAEYVPSVPTFRAVLGYEPGERITSHDGILRYFDALAAAQANRVKVFEYGRSWEGRKLIYAVVASESNMKRLPEIRAGMRRLADPRAATDAEVAKLTATLPATVWIAAGVHGNELSSSEAVMLAAYHLLAARKDPMVADILANTIVLLVPTQNPDGHDRFVRHFEQSEGIEPDAHPQSAEHIEPWPGGRGNHYLFDLNRDWIALTQPEIRGQVKALIEWLPLVFADLHEMGADSTYYFAPEAAPFNPHLAKDQVAALDWFGRNNARWFDKFGFSYFTRDVFDAFYPGYGASWPSYYGSVAMTYEQASSRGLAMRRADETTFHFRETVQHHFVAALSTAETAARNRGKLLANFRAYRRTAVEEGRSEAVRAYILPRRGDVAAVDKLAGLLAEQGVEVKRAMGVLRAAGVEYPAGSYSIDLAQPAKRLVRTLLDTDVKMEEGFLKEQERRRAKKLPDEIYDVTAWSLPLMFNVEVVAASGAGEAQFENVDSARPPAGRLTHPSAALAFLAPWGTAAQGRLLTAALRQGLRVWSTDKPFVLSGRRYPAGTLIFKVKENGEGLAAKLEKLAAATGAEIAGTDSGWVEEGANFGSRHVGELRRPTVALAWDRPVASTATGATRYVLERQYHYPVTPIRAQSLGNADLSKVQVLILPDGAGDGYAAAFGTNGIRRLKDWVMAGGTIVAVEGALEFLGDPKVGLLDLVRENAARPAGDDKKTPEKTTPVETRVAGKLLTNEADYQKAIQAEKEMPDEVPGVLVRARLDPDHWITAGASPTVNALFNGRDIFSPMKTDKGVNAALFLASDKLVASGYLWRENRDQLAYKPLVVVERQGRGYVIGFTADPCFRAYLDGMNVLFLNAVFRAPAHARPVPFE